MNSIHTLIKNLIKVYLYYVATFKLVLVCEDMQKGLIPGALKSLSWRNLYCLVGPMMSQITILHK